MTPFATLGRVFFALAAIGSGVLQLSRQSFVRLVPPPPAWLGAPRLWAVASGMVLVGAGLAWLLNRGTRVAALVVGGMLVMTFSWYLPAMAANPGAGYVWTNPAKVVALMGGCVLLGWPPVVGRKSGGSAWFGAGAMGIFLILGGVQHGVYVDFVTTLVPEWLPGRRGWVWLTGGALVAGGLGLWIPPTRRWAAVASGAMIFSWVCLLHVPRALASAGDAGEIAGAFEALALSGGCWLLATMIPAGSREARS